MRGISLLLLLSLPAAAQEETVIEADYISFEKEGDRNIAFLSSPVVTRGGIRIQADHMILWFPLEGEEASFEELYAEGNVVYRSGMQELKAERMYFDAVGRRAYLVHLQARMKDPESGKSYRIIAEQVRSLAEGKFQAKKVRLSSCDYGVPHYDVYIGEGTWTGREPHGEEGTFDIFPFREWTLGGGPVVARIGEVPFFWLPAVILKSEWLRDFPLRSVRVEETSRFGWSALTEWGFPLSKGFLDALNPWDSGEEEDDGRRWGDAEFSVDWRRERGWAGGLDLEWKWENYFGYGESYFLHDEGRSDNDFDEKFDPLERKDRGRVRGFHRRDLEGDWRYELELSWISDKDLLEEFFEREFKEGKEQETSFYVRWKPRTMGAYLWERHRLNDFQDQLEMLPRLHFELLHQPVLPSVWDRLLLFQSTDASHLRYRNADGDPDRDERTWRGDFLNELTIPADFTWFTVAPFGSLRGSFWEQDINGDEESRWLWSLGGRVRVDIHGVHGLTWKAIGLRRLRHIVQLEARYAHNIHSTEKSSSLYPFDDTELIDEFEEAVFSFRNRLETKVIEEGEEKSWEFFDLGVTVEYYPNPDRDTTSFRATNHLAPFHWITLAPDPVGEAFPLRHWSNIHWDMRFRLRNSVGLSGRGEYNFEVEQEESREIAFHVSPFSGLTLSAGGTYVRGVTNAWSASLRANLGEKWSLQATVQYDFDAEAYTEQKLVVGRDFHDFVVQGVFENDEGRNEQKYYVTVVPKFLERLWK